MIEHILVPTAPGELIDKLTILRLKEERMTDPAKVANVQIEMAALSKTADSHIPPSVELTVLWEELYAINGDLWVIEDDIRDCENAKNFGEDFIRLALAVYITNDRRADVKKKINLLLGSTLIEEKFYADHGAET
tara:strand:+ start:523 stop:927 length:405 start_codon:yes stop_codon:yes gene_type:complete